MSISDIFNRIVIAIKSIRWGWGALFAVFAGVEYFHFFKLFGSELLGAIASYFLLLIIAKIMSKE